MQRQPKKRQDEVEIARAEDCIGVYLFEDSTNLHIPLILNSYRYRPRNPYFREILSIMVDALNRGTFPSVRSQLSAEAYNYWSNLSVSLSVLPNFRQLVEDSLSYLVNVARCDLLYAIFEQSLNRLSPPTVMDVISDLLSQMSVILSLGGAETLSEQALADYVSTRLRERIWKKKVSLKFGIRFLDERGIILPRREYSLISGKTGAGKTTFASILTFNFLRAHENDASVDGPLSPIPLRILFVTTEMPAEAVFAKIVSNFLHTYLLPRIDEFSEFSDSDVPILRRLKWVDFLEYADEGTLDVVLRVVKKFVELYGDRLAIYHSSIVTPQDIFLVAMSQMLRWDGLDVVIVDFIQNIRTKSEMEGDIKVGSRGRGSSGNVSREIGMVAQEFQQFCSRFDVIGIVLSQVNDMGEIRDSRVVEHLCALHVRMGMFYRDLASAFRKYLRTERKFVDGKPTSEKLVEAQALEYATLAQAHPSIKLLDVSVLKNRYGQVIPNLHFIMWEPAIPRIVKICNLTETMTELERWRNDAEIQRELKTVDLFPF